MTARSPFAPLAPAVARLRTTNPYAVDAAVAVLVLFAVSLQWLFPDEGDDPLSWQGWLLGAATALPLVWRRAAPFATPAPCRWPPRRRRCTTRRRPT